MKICAHGERYRNLSSGIIQIQPFVSNIDHVSVLIGIFFRSDLDGKIDEGSLSDDPETVEGSSRCSWWIRLLIGRTTVEAALTS